MGFKRIRASALAVGLASMLSMVTVLPGSAANTTVTVSPTDMQGWSFAQEIAVGSGALVNGPSNPPIGLGSAQLTVDSTGRELLYNPQYAGTRLDQIDVLTYSTFSQTATSILAVSLQLDVDYDLTDANLAWQGRLVYEPYQNGTVTSGVWQTWNARAGEWWASGAPGNGVCPQSNPCTWSEVLATFPNAGIRTSAGNVNFKAGGPWAGGFIGNVDRLVIGGNSDTTTWNFESFKAATNKDECKNGGWQNVRRADGSTFKNQGDCVSYTNTGR
jgi:hypothetical protein